MLTRMAARGEKITVRLKMEAHMLQTAFRETSLLKFPAGKNRRRS